MRSGSKTETQPRSRSGLLSIAAAATGCCLAKAGVSAFLAPSSAPRVGSNPSTSSATYTAALPVMASSSSSASVMKNAWLLAGVSMAAGVASSRRVSRHAEEKAAAVAVEEKKEEEEKKEPFDVYKPATYGNISMDDVKKYGAAGTLSYVITELLFWAIAFPAECLAFWELEGHWPDFSKPEESAAVFALVFAASNIARLLLPIRFGAALAMAPWVDENIMKRFGGNKEDEAKASESA